MGFKLKLHQIHNMNFLMKFFIFFYKTALHIATILGNPEIVSLLLHHNEINVNIKDEIL